MNRSSEFGVGRSLFSVRCLLQNLV